MLLDTEVRREREGSGDESKKGSFVQSPEPAELDPCLARVRREQRAAAKCARFGVHFTQIITFSAKMYLEKSWFQNATEADSRELGF